MRTKKSYLGTDTHYNYADDGTLLSMTKGVETLWFLYDEAGSPVGFTYDNTPNTSGDEATAFYIKNLQGDITGIINEGLLMAEYRYYAWGKLISISVTLGWLGELNPLRYRGYVYDSESGLYY